MKQRVAHDYVLYDPASALVAPPAIDILIVTYNAAECIERCIESVMRSSYPAEYVRIIILDNNSVDNSVSVVSQCKRTYTNLIVIENGENIGFGEGMNRAFEHATAPYIFVLNPDTELDPECLTRLVSRAEQSEEHGFVAWEARQQPYEHPKAYDPVTLEADWMSGACFLMKSDRFKELDGFDRRIFLYCEDIDLSLRIRMNGWKIMYVPDAVVIHDTYEEPGITKPAQFYHSLVSHALLRYKYTGIKNFLFFHLHFLKALFRPLSLPNVRRRMIYLYVENIPNFYHSFIWKLKNRKNIKKTDLNFNVVDIGIKRYGAFHRIEHSNTTPLVSIVIRTRERPDFLRDALQSVRNQTYQNVEVIVAEDRSDSSRDVINEFSDLDITHIMVGEPGGRCVAGNLAFARAKGKYINLLDDDDLFYADHLEVLVNALENDGIVKAAYTLGFEVTTKIIRESPLTFVEYMYKTLHRRRHDIDVLLRRNYIPIHCMMFDRSLFLEEGGFDEKIDLLEDWDLWIRYSHYTDFLYIDKTTCIFRSPYGIKKIKGRIDALWETYDIVREKHVDQTPVREA
ncbi:MAG: glycosyltransferase family 2 protein [Deltaproteobacteria bacterium]|nr:glycosyltransferase family 2 protein [Candidatus Zymogenaceae bacterium]